MSIHGDLFDIGWKKFKRALLVVGLVILLVGITAGWVLGAMQ